MWHLHVFYTVHTVVASLSVCPWLSKALGKLQWTAPEAALSCPRLWKFLQELFGISATKCFGISAGFQLEPTASFHGEKHDGAYMCISLHSRLWKDAKHKSVHRLPRRFDAECKVASNCLLKAIPSAARPNKSRSSSQISPIQKFEFDLRLASEQSA